MSDTATTPAKLSGFLVDISNFPSPPSSDIRLGHHARAAEMLKAWTRYIGDPDVQEGADYEDFYEQAARLEAAVDAFGAHNVWLRGRRRGAPVRNLGTGHIVEAAAVGHLPRYGAQVSADSHHHVDLADEILANRYFGYRSFLDRAGRRTAMAGFCTDRHDDHRAVLRRMNQEGVTSFFIKLTGIKAGIHEIDLPRMCTPEGIDRAFLEITDGMLHLEGRSGTLFIQERVQMTWEYRFFVVDQAIVTGAACVEEHTPLDNKGDAFGTLLREHRQARSRVVSAPERVTKLISFTVDAVEDLAGEEPALRNYTIDVAFGPDGEPLVIELNGLLNSGLYASRPQLVTEALAAQASRTDMAGHLPRKLTRDAAISCTCGIGGMASEDAFVDHIAAVLAADRSTAVRTLAEAHTNSIVNEGMCGGCEYCGNNYQMASCRICGLGDSPCAASYIAAEFREEDTCHPHTWERETSPTRK